MHNQLKYTCSANIKGRTGSALTLLPLNIIFVKSVIWICTSLKMIKYAQVCNNSHLEIIANFKQNSHDYELSALLNNIIPDSIPEDAVVE